MPRITRPQVYRVVREMLPKQRLGPAELLRWLEDVQLRNGHQFGGTKTNSSVSTASHSASHLNWAHEVDADYDRFRSLSFSGVTSS